MPGEHMHWPDLLSRWGNPEAPAAAAVQERLEVKVLRVRGDRVLLEHAHDARTAIGDDVQEVEEQERWPTLDEVRAAQQACRIPPLLLGYDEERQLWVDARGAIYVPPGAHNLRLRVMVVAHCGAAGHHGQHATLQLLRLAFCWPEMEEEALAFIRSCILCVKTRSGVVKPLPWGTQLRGRVPGESVHMDFLTLSELKGTEHGLLVLKDGCSFFGWLFECLKFNAKAAEEALLQWSAVFGVPRILVTDGGAHFKNKLVKALTLRLRVEHHITTPYASWANGAIERLNRAIIAVFRTLLAETSTPYHEWRSLRPLVMATLNQKLSRDGLDNLCPSTVMLNREVPTPLSTVTGQWLEEAGLKEVPDGPAIRAAYEKAAAALQANWLRVNDAHDRRAAQNKAARVKAGAKHTEDFAVGDYVLVRVAVPRNKLRVKWLGPMRVVDTVHDRVWILEDLLTKKRQTVHGQRLMKYADRQLQVTEDLCNQIAYDDVFQVEKFINWRITDDDEMEVRVRWLGFTAAGDSWEPPQRLHEDVPVMLEQYFKAEMEKGGTPHMEVLLETWAAEKARSGDTASSVDDAASDENSVPAAATVQQNKRGASRTRAARGRGGGGSRGRGRGRGRGSSSAAPTGRRSARLSSQQ